MQKKTTKKTLAINMSTMWREQELVSSTDSPLEHVLLIVITMGYFSLQENIKL